MPLPLRTETEAWTSEPRSVAATVVVDVEADRAVGGEREPLAGGLVDLDDEADAAAGQAARDAGGRARHQARRVEVLHVERQRRPAGDRVGSVSTSSTASGAASTVVVAVQVLMVENSPGAAAPCRRPA